MIGVAGILMRATNVVSRIKRIAGNVNTVRNEFQTAGGGVRGAVAGAKTAVRLAFADTVTTARNEIEQLNTSF